MHQVGGASGTRAPYGDAIHDVPNDPLAGTMSHALR
jgi:hypothetical protein